MSAQRYKSMARKHWAQWLPKKTAELKADGELDQALQTAGRAAFERVLELMQQGYQAHEAEEVALKEFVLLQPELDADEDDWEAKELRELEREYRRQMRGWS